MSVSFESQYATSY